MGGLTVDGNVNEGVADFSAGVENATSSSSVQVKINPLQ